jgi:hypothetical protein
MHIMQAFIAVILVPWMHGLIHIGGVQRPKRPFLNHSLHCPQIVCWHSKRAPRLPGATQIIVRVAHDTNWQLHRGVGVVWVAELAYGPEGSVGWVTDPASDAARCCYVRVWTSVHSVPLWSPYFIKSCESGFYMSLSTVQIQA